MPILVRSSSSLWSYSNSERSYSCPMRFSSNCSSSSTILLASYMVISLCFSFCSCIWILRPSSLASQLLSDYVAPTLSVCLMGDCLTADKGLLLSFDQIVRFCYTPRFSSCYIEFCLLLTSCSSLLELLDLILDLTPDDYMFSSFALFKRSREEVA